MMVPILLSDQALHHIMYQVMLQLISLVTMQVQIYLLAPASHQVACQIMVLHLTVPVTMLIHINLLLPALHQVIIVVTTLMQISLSLPVLHQAIIKVKLQVTLP